MSIAYFGTDHLETWCPVMKINNSEKPLQEHFKYA